MFEYTFGFDLENIECVMEYVKKNYDESEYEMGIGYGDDIMNWMKIVDKNDEELKVLIENCDGGGEFEEE